MSSVTFSAVPYFPHIISYTAQFSEGGREGVDVTEHKNVLIFFAFFAWNNSHSKKNSARYYHKRNQVST